MVWKDIMKTSISDEAEKMAKLDKLEELQRLEDEYKEKIKNVKRRIQEGEDIDVYSKCLKFR